MRGRVREALQRSTCMPREALHASRSTACLAKQRWRGGPDGEKPCLMLLEPPLLMEPLPAYSVAPSLSSRTYRGPPSNPRKSVAWRREDRRETGPRGSSSNVRTQRKRWVRVVASGGSPNPSLRCHRDNGAPYRLGRVPASRKSVFSSSTARSLWLRPQNRRDQAAWVGASITPPPSTDIRGVSSKSESIKLSQLL